ncbi:hypothetical protein MNBD_GAMMA06-499 [hydrothermal vent metagenome]|uniref:Serine aminopeptidase S33 domain-containing protein n=1 Tax=hydrothermal vent metagenome TaxID=652676 RepID=A0A3B0WZF8_9ZZZZ
MRAFIKKQTLRLVIILSLAYACLLAIGIGYSDKLIFLPPAPTYTWSNELFMLKAKSYSVPGAKNNIAAHYLKNPAAIYTILYNHGNAVDLGGLEHTALNFFEHGYSVIMYDYSGYGLSEGVPSEQQTYNDVQAVYSYLLTQQHLKPEQIIAYGHSLGAAVATGLAFKNPVAALVLESPFASAFRVKTTYSLIPFDKFNSIDKIDKINAPLFITHSRDDAVIAFWHSEALFKKAKQPKKAFWFESEGHSGIPNTTKFWEDLKFFISTINK